MTIDTRRTLRIPAELERVAEVRTLVREVAGACNAPQPCMDDLVQAVDEAATNVIMHGYGGGPGWLDVAAERVDDTGTGTSAQTRPSLALQGRGNRRRCVVAFEDDRDGTRDVWLARRPCGG